MLDYGINYLISLPNEDPENSSLFQGFSRDIFDIDVYNILCKILTDLPASLIETTYRRDIVIAMRMSGMFRYQIIPVNVDSLKYYDKTIMSPFTCIFSINSTCDSTQNYIDSFELPALHISTVKTKSTITLQEFNYKHLIQYAQQVLTDIQDSLTDLDVSKTNEVLKNAKRWRKKAIDSVEREHMFTALNEICLKSLNYYFKERNKLQSYIRDDIYIDAILNSVNAIKNERDRIYHETDNALFYPPCVTSILFLPSMYNSKYKQQIDIHKKEDVLDKKEVSRALKLLQKQKTYSIHLNLEKMHDILASKEFAMIMQEREKEVRMSYCAVAIKACSNFSPCLSLSPGFNSLRGDILNFAKCDRANGSNKRVKVSRLYRRLAENMSELIDDKFLDFVKKDPYSIKIISDIPIEWIRVDDLPIMMKYNTSRISSTPGNLFLHSVTDFRGLLLSPEDLSEILVLRSYKKNDPIRNLLVQSINHFLKDVDLTKTAMEAYKNNPQKRKEYHEEIGNKERVPELDVNITLVDVSSEKEIIEALNEFNGNILIFDGHGVHDEDTQIGSILLNDSKYDIWNLKNKTRVPPIVILSACDTHPIDASHASTANGFLAAGALTVLGTVLPMDVMFASIFIGRLIMRIKSYIPTTVYGFDTPIRWNNVISGLLRMNYMTETMRLLEENTSMSFDKHSHFRIGNEINMYINSNNPKWYERLIEMISEECSMTLSEVKDKISRYALFPESMKYVQLGNPEQILITNKDSLEIA